MNHLSWISGERRTLAFWQRLLEEDLDRGHLHSAMDRIQRDAFGTKNTMKPTDKRSSANMGGTRIVLFATLDPNAEAFNPWEHAYPIGPLLTEAEAEMAGLWVGHSMAPDHELR